MLSVFLPMSAISARYNNGATGQRRFGVASARSFLRIRGIEMRPASTPASVKDFPVQPKLRLVITVLTVLCLATTSTVNAGEAAGLTPSTTANYYVSLGDSYAAGNQPTASASAHTDTNGFAYQVVKSARAKGYRFDL